MEEADTDAVIARTSSASCKNPSFPKPTSASLQRTVDSVLRAAPEERGAVPVGISQNWQAQDRDLALSVRTHSAPLDPLANLS